MTPRVLLTLALSVLLHLGTVRASSAQSTPQPTASVSPGKTAAPEAKPSPAGITATDAAYLRAVTALEAKQTVITAAAESFQPKEVETYSQAVLDKYDLNHNGVLDPEEKAAFERDRTIRHAELLQKYDTNHDGVLDDNERAAMRADLRRQRQQAEGTDPLELVR